MKPTAVSITYERKFNLGDYNSAHIGLTLWADVDDGEDQQEVVRELQRQARELVREEYRRLLKPGSIPANGTV